jgi:hypothetical protein
MTKSEFWFSMIPPSRSDDNVSLEFPIYKMYSILNLVPVLNLVPNSTQCAALDLLYLLLVLPSGEWLLILLRRLLWVFRRIFTRDLWSVLLKCASTALQSTQDACLNKHGHDLALLDLHLGSRTRTPILQCLPIFDTVSANSCPPSGPPRLVLPGVVPNLQIKKFKVCIPAY